MGNDLEMGIETPSMKWVEEGAGETGLEIARQKAMTETLGTDPSSRTN